MLQDKVDDRFGILQTMLVADAWFVDHLDRAAKRLVSFLNYGCVLGEGTTGY